MWESRASENGNGWPDTFTGTDSVCGSMVVSSSSPRVCSREGPSCSTPERMRQTDLDKTCVPDEMLVPPVQDDLCSGSSVSWQLLSVTLLRVPSVGFGIAVSGGRDNPHFVSGDPAVVVSDVVPSGPAWGLLQVNDRILSANGVSLENADYASAVKIMKESQQLNMIIKRRAPVPLIEYEQRTLKFTLSKSRKKEDFGIVLGCKFYIKEITNRKLAEKDPGLREGDTVLRINGQSVDGITIEEATKWLMRSREKLSLVVQRDVRRGSSRWPSQNTVYERLGSVSATPRHSPSPMLSSHQPVGQRSSAEWSQAEQCGSYGDFFRINGSISSGQGQAEGDPRIVRFRKFAGSLGIRVIGGNRVGIFVSAVQDNSPAAVNGIRPGDRILAVNDKQMAGVTREEAVRHLLAMNDEDIALKVEHAAVEFEQVRSSQLGDDFYIRTHFANHKTTVHLELPFNNGDIFHVTDTLHGGTVGMWRATRVYSSLEGVSNPNSEGSKGVIPNQEAAETLARASRMDTSTIGRSTFFRRRLKERRTKSLTKNVIDDVAFSESGCDMALPAYERVVLRHPPFQRPVVMYGPLADIARQMLLTNFALRFTSAGEEAVVRLSSIDAAIAANKHCVLDVSPGSVERLQLAQYAPIVILIDVEGRTRIRELRNKAGAASMSSRKLLEQAHKLKKQHSHLLTATLDATKEDGWFDALRQLIAHLQDRRVWMPEFRPSTNLNDVVLLPMQGFYNQSDSDADSLKGDYSNSDYISRKQLQSEREASVLRSAYEPQNWEYGVHVPRPLHAARSQPQANHPLGPFLGYPAAGYYQNMHANSRSLQPSQQSPGYYDVKQILAEQSSDYYGPQSMVESPRSPYQSPYNTAYSFRQAQPYMQEPVPIQPAVRHGLFYDHLTRSRWGGGTQSERRIPSIQSHLSPLRPTMRASPVSTAPSQSSTLMNESNIRYADESPKGHLQAVCSTSSTSSNSGNNNVGNNNSNNNGVGHGSPKTSRLGDVESVIDRRGGKDGACTNTALDVTDDVNGDTLGEGPARDGEATVIEHVSGVIDSNGGTLSCPQSGVMLIVPEGAIAEGIQQEIYIKVCRATGDDSRPPLDESRGESLLSPLVMCGPQDLQFNVPVELRLPHSSSNNGENWSFALKSGTGEQWNQIALDENASSLVTDKFVSVKISHF